MGNAEKGLQSYLSGLQALQKAPPSSTHAGLLLGIADYYSNIGQPDSASWKYQEALQIAIQAKDSVNMGRTWLSWAILAVDSAFRDEATWDLWIDIAFERMYQAERLLKSSSDTTGYMAALEGLGNLYILIDKSTQGRILLENALETAHQSGHQGMAASIYNNLGTLYQYLGQDYRESQAVDSANWAFRRAKAYLTAGLEASQKSGKLDLAQSLNYNLSQVHNDLEEYEKSLEFLNASFAISESLNRTNVVLAGMMEIYEQEKLKAQNLEVQNNYNLLLTGSLIAILAVLILALMVYLFSLRRQQSHQAQVEALLGEREQVALGSMLRGQEDAYKRIGKELHDHVGMLLATVKLHFNNLEDKL
ncbi:MAG: hypothetical protein AAFR59_17090, partial [Bacteroidota bacterium]